MRITLVAGARPNFMKIAPIIHAIKNEQQRHPDLSYRLIHTGQHYDSALSQIFFKELGIPDPDENLEVGSGSQATQTANIMIRFENELVQNAADVVLVVGDINSTMACSIVAKKLAIQLVHVEAGIRSFDITMPEEINRIVTDAIADYFFTTSEYANDNLKRAGVDQSRIHFVGNTMIDTLKANHSRFRKPALWDTMKLTEGNYFVLTLHRPSNVDKPEILEEILTSITTNSEGFPIIFPVHPRTVTNLNKLSLHSRNLITVDPMGYLEFMYLIQNAKAVITDSGGLQEETTVLQVPCLTMRKNSERPETITFGTNELVHDSTDLQLQMRKILQGKWKKGAVPYLWDGNASTRIVKILLELYSEHR